MKNQRGGVLLDLFVIGVLVGVGFWAWKNAPHWVPPGGWSRCVKKWGHRTRVFFHRERPSEGLTGGAGSFNPLSSKKSLALWAAPRQAGFRKALAAAGVEEKNILKAFNESMEDAEARWVMSVLEISAPEGFHSGKFLQSLVPFLNESKWRVLKDETVRGRWVLEMGVGEWVLQRLVVHPRDRASIVLKGSAYV